VIISGHGQAASKLFPGILDAANANAIEKIFRNLIGGCQQRLREMAAQADLWQRVVPKDTQDYVREQVKRLDAPKSDPKSK
jgi:hypothetical protein